MQLSRSAIRTVALVVACGLAIGCGETQRGSPPVTVGGTTGQELAERQLLRRGNGAEPESLDPHRITSVAGVNVAQDLFEGLTVLGPDATAQPGVAESWTISDDGLVYTFALRPDARWSNGDAVTAADFEFSLRRAVDPRTMSDYAAILYPLRNARGIVQGDLPPEELGVRAVDDRTLEIRLEAATPYLLGLLTHSMAFPVHRPSVERHGERHARPGNLVGNGAYVLDEWVVQSHIRAVRNPYYWNNADTAIDTVYFYSIESADSELRRYRAGELDWTEKVPTRQLDWIRRNLPDELETAPYFGSYVYGFNLQKPPFQGNPKLRQALSMALDREVITGRITGAEEIPAWGWVPSVPGYSQQRFEWADWDRERREAEARRLYEAAGYSAENPLRFELLYNTDDNHRRLAAAMAAMWKEVLGAEAVLRNQEWKVFLQTRRQREETQLFRYGWIGDYLDPFTFAELLHSEYGLNDMGYSNQRYDALVDAAARETDPQRRMELLEEAERVMLADMPILPLYFYVTSRMVRPWVGGHEPNIMDRHYTRNLYILKH